MTVPAVEHWQGVYGTRAADSVSWFQERPEVSLRLLAPLVSAHGAVLDVGAGASRLVDGLLEQGWGQVTGLDLADAALAAGRDRLAGEPRARFVVADLLAWEPDRSYDAWHDRAVFHFLTESGDRDRYVALAERALAPGGSLVLGTFAPDGPDRCSGLPVRRYAAAALAEAFGDGFELVHHEHERHETPVGVGQAFTWVVLRRV